MKKSITTPKQQQLHVLGQINKKLLKKLAAETLDLNSNDHGTQDEYLNAMRANDIQKLNYFATMGESPRQQIMNVDAYRFGLKYGFTQIIFDEYGWLDNDNWIQTETIELRISKDKAYVNAIRLSQGINGNWSYGITYSFGSAGGGWGPSIYGKPYQTKQECQEAALSNIKEQFTKTFERNKKRPDSSNYNIQYMRQVFQKIEEIQATLILNQVQLNLFAA